MIKQYAYFHYYEKHVGFIKTECKFVKYNTY